MAEVNDESYAYELLFHLETCNPLPLALDWEVSIEPLFDREKVALVARDEEAAEHMADGETVQRHPPRGR